jgi:squalene-hopene/tetraprenyl-beta-curcumene cyclase
VLGASAAGAAAAGPLDPSLTLEARASIKRAASFLGKAQQPDGGWCESPAVTALAATALLGTGAPEDSPCATAARKALDCIRAAARPDGAIGEELYPTYSTSVCVMALIEAGAEQDEELIGRAKTFLLGVQADEAEGLDASGPDFGGWGYEPGAGEARRADLSNTQFALEAVRALESVAEEDTAATATGEARSGGTELAYERAIEFLQRCQNLQATNDQPWASNDGGFVYRPGESKAGATPEGGLRSYGGMTYAGLKSMVYARLSKADRRVQAAYDWVRRNWTVQENPGLGQQGLYYYYLTMARALHAYGDDVIVDAAGNEHNWRAELLSELLRVQQADGSWVNANGRWMEGIPELATAYAVLAIEHATASRQEEEAEEGAGAGAVDTGPTS